MACTFENSYLESGDFLKTVLHSMTAFEVPLNVFGTFLIVFKSPKSMSTAKRVILLLHTVSAVVDFSVTFLGIPYILTPYPGGITIGFLSDFGIQPVVQVGLGAVLTAVFAITLIFFFENRYDAVVIENMKSSKRNFRRSILLLIDAVACTLLIASILLTLPDSATGIAHFLSLNTCIPVNMINQSNFVDFYPGPSYVWLNIVFIVIVDSFLFSQCVFFVFSTAYHLFFCVRIVSKSTQLIQRKFFVALVIQALAPFVAFAGPIVYMYVATIIRYYNQKYNNYAIILAGFNGLLTTITMIMVHPAYRNAVLRMISMTYFRERNKITIVYSTRSSFVPC
ncbi:unnamed protein product [Caenorhabditis sp. 36 PRJEB53466]|nr:unnamed protein product [Caenorhabditis sp. 36 PRJEB53466]